MVNDASTGLVKTQLTRVKPDLERHCGATLVDCQEPQFLHYALAENRFRIQQQGLLLAQRNYSSEAR